MTVSLRVDKQIIRKTKRGIHPGNRLPGRCMGKRNVLHLLPCPDPDRAREAKNDPGAITQQLARVLKDLGCIGTPPARAAPKWVRSLSPCTKLGNYGIKAGFVRLKIVCLNQNSLKS